ncbi:alpha/beta hydrolase [Dactylosporangium salmoneum]|uniref:Alpha/beta hydrolase fold domain-containing protein n=1 Tax=Dactylosporangium salmoneum TaxID=53361 RepID=A0ABN3FYP7_9ACTN
MNVDVLVGPDLAADLDLVRELAEAEFAGLGVDGAVREAPDLAAALEGTTGAVVALPGPTAPARRLMTEPGRHAPRTVWLDLTATGPRPVAAGSEHHQGREIWGVTWAVRRAVHRLRHPARRIAYGPDEEQWGELRLPAGTGPAPVAVLLHGGFWRSVWGADLMDAMAIDLAGRGFAAWNLEYRRPDRHGWAATTADVAAGLAFAGAADARVDPSRLVLFGHSAGGQLAVRAAADAPGAVSVVVSQAGVLDLTEGQRRGIGTGAVAGALRGDEAALAAADPLLRLPLGVPVVVVQGRADGLDLVDMSRRYGRAALAAGDRVVRLEVAADHFDVIDPRTPAWTATMDAVSEILT